MELLRFSAFWCGAILFGSIQLEEAGELNFVLREKLTKAVAAFYPSCDVNEALASATK